MFEKIIDRFLCFIYTLFLTILVLDHIDANYLSNYELYRIVNNNFIEGIYCSPGVDVSFIPLIKRAFESTGPLYDMFIEDGGIVYYTTDGEDLNNSILDKDSNVTVGVFKSKKHYIDKEHQLRIYLLSDYEYTLSETVVHEMGHYLDYKLGRISGSNSFETLYEQYKGIDLNVYSKKENYTYITSNPTEFFAERYADYILHSELLREVEPALYDFYEMCILEVFVNE